MRYCVEALVTVKTPDNVLLLVVRPARLAGLTAVTYVRMSAAETGRVISEVPESTMVGVVASEVNAMRCLPQLMPVPSA